MLRALVFAFAFTALALTVLVPPSAAWDSQTTGGGTIGLPMHVAFTSTAADEVKQINDDYRREITQDVKNALRDGCLTELHEEDTKSVDIKNGQKYGVNVDKKRTDHKGTNAGCDDIGGWWQDALDAYRSGQKLRAYFYVGILLHMVQDMGVPAHANGVYHQAKIEDFDNFEFNATFHETYLNLRGNQSRARINREDPRYSDPSQYYLFSKDWTHTDAPDYNNRNTYPKFRAVFWEYTEKHKELMQNRQYRTWACTYWCLQSVERNFLGK